MVVYPNLLDMTMEERPKVFNTDQVKTWKFCRGTNGDWFEVDSAGHLTRVGNVSVLHIWEANKNSYLETMLKSWKKEQTNNEQLEELKSLVGE